MQAFANGFMPLNNSTINYTQVFFKWPQIENAEYYTLAIQNNISESFETVTISNSFIIAEFIDWDNEYTWEICGIDAFDNILSCYDEKTFIINSLPAYYPNNIEVILTSDEYYPGITILDFDSIGFSVAINKQGNPVWFIDKYLFGSFNPKILVTQLLKSGNFIGLGIGSGYEFDINGNIIFQTPSQYGVHHHFIKENNTYFLIDAVTELHPCPEGCPENLPEDIYWKGDKFVQLNHNGEMIWEWNVFNYINLSEYNPYYLQRFSNAYPEATAMDWTHANSIFYDSNTENIFISIRNLSRIIKVDYSSMNIIWELGDINFMDEIYFNNEIEFSTQHSVKKIDNDHILLFDNHSFLVPQISRCIELEYNEISDSVEIIWEYTMPDSLFTGSRGECDRLDNGNTLIDVGRTGNILEINNNNELIWHLSMQNDNVEIASFRSSRVDNLYPLAYSFIINNLKGSYANQNYYIDNIDYVQATIYNIGWSVQEYNLFILDSNYEPIYSSFISINGNDLELIQINLSEMNINSDDNFIFKVFPSVNPDLYEEIHFSIIDNYLGDFNNDDIVNILDAIIMVNAIINNNFNNSYDLNNDDLNNILDIVLLINIILE